LSMHSTGSCSQAQMQSGTTGINSIRIYNPIKQGIDHDPDGEFIRRWVPELKQMPGEYLHQPWECPQKMGSYPLPVVDEKQARKKAADKLYALRKNRTHKEQAGKIVSKHGSRKSGIPSTTERRRKKVEVDKRQMNLF
ncbi:MAG: FAD-binding domain-containing protein, partial [Limnobacter sp.]|nr:FAD-binding domain-containing protein [Limnobacter sp.]